MILALIHVCRRLSRLVGDWPPSVCQGALDLHTLLCTLAILCEALSSSVSLACIHGPQQVIRTAPVRPLCTLYQAPSLSLSLSHSLQTHRTPSSLHAHRQSFTHSLATGHLLSIGPAWVEITAAQMGFYDFRTVTFGRPYSTGSELTDHGIWANAANRKTTNFKTRPGKHRSYTQAALHTDSRTRI